MPEVEALEDEPLQEARSRSRKAIMLDVRLANGTIESFNYTYLTRVSYSPGDTLVLRFGKDEVRLEGRRLEKIRETISDHRVKFVQEGTEAEEGLKPEDAMHIDRIVITEGTDQW